MYRLSYFASPGQDFRPFPLVRIKNRTFIVRFFTSIMGMA